jgi:hypothetical protein
MTLRRPKIAQEAGNAFGPARTETRDDEDDLHFRLLAAQELKPDPESFIELMLACPLTCPGREALP